jgi:hypothetical protein
MKLTELRKELKVIGYKVKTTTLSFGKHATYTDMTGEELPTMFRGEAEIAIWSTLINYLKDNDRRLLELRHRKAFVD